MAFPVANHSGVSVATAVISASYNVADGNVRDYPRAVA